MTWPVMTADLAMGRVRNRSMTPSQHVGRDADRRGDRGEGRCHDEDPGHDEVDIAAVRAGVDGAAEQEVGEHHDQDGLQCDVD